MNKPSVIINKLSGIINNNRFYQIDRNRYKIIQVCRYKTIFFFYFLIEIGYPPPFNKLIVHKLLILLDSKKHLFDFQIESFISKPIIWWKYIIFFFTLESYTISNNARGCLEIWVTFYKLKLFSLHTETKAKIKYIVFYDKNVLTLILFKYFPFVFLFI